MSHGLSLKAYDGAAALAIKNREAVVLFEFFILQVYGSFIAILQNKYKSDFWQYCRNVPSDSYLLVAW